MPHVLQKFLIKLFFDAFVYSFLGLCYLMVDKESRNFHLGLIIGNKNMWTGNEAFCFNGSLRSYWNVLVNFVPDNQNSKIIQHIANLQELHM